MLLPEGIGDDSDIIKQEGGGAVFDLARPGSVPEALASLAQQMAQPGYRQRVRRLAERHRSIELTRQAYVHFFGVPASQ